MAIWILCASSTDSGVGLPFLCATAPSRALCRGTGKRVGDLLGALHFLPLGKNSEHLKGELFPVCCCIPLEKAGGAAQGP